METLLGGDGEFFFRFVRYVVGDGSKISFWHS